MGKKTNVLVRVEGKNPLGEKKDFRTTLSLFNKRKDNLLEKLLTEPPYSW